MNDEQLLRYSRQIMLSQIDIGGQQQLIDSRVLVIGMGGLGCPAAIYLAAAGVGQLVLSDFDDVDLSNLQRQIAHHTSDIGIPKVESAKDTLNAINPLCSISTINHKLEGDELLQQVRLADVVVDCSDNFSTRFAINDACVAARVPLVSGAAIRFEGQISVFDARQDDSPCYNCLYPKDGSVDTSCSVNGVIAPITGIIGSMQALETIKLITGAGEALIGQLILIDAMTMHIHTMRLPKNPTCPTCGQGQ
jgi:adenylyltransferase/sulfurtransferase